MCYALRVLSALLFVIVGAAACSIYRQSWSGLATGALIGWYVWFAYAGAQCATCMPHWSIPVSAGAVWLLGRSSSPASRRLIDIPADTRILVATSISFLLRGLVPLGWIFGALVLLAGLVFGFALTPKLSKPPLWEDSCRTTEPSMTPILR